MFPSVRHLIVAVVASVVALSCGFAMFAAFRVNHEPLSRLATGAAPLQLAAGNPIPSVAMPAPAESFGDRFPPNQAAIAGASTEAPPPQPEHDDSVEPPRAVASTTANAPATDGAEPAQSAPPAPVAQAPAAEPDAKPDEVAATPSEAPPATPGEPVPAKTETAATEPPAEPAASAEPAAPTEQASQELKQEPNPGSNPDTKPNSATTTTAEPPPSEAPQRPPTGTALPPKCSVHAKPARPFNRSASHPESAVRSCRHRAALSPGRSAPAKPARSFSRSASLQASAARSCRQRAIERRPIFGVGLMAARAETT